MHFRIIREQIYLFNKKISSCVIKQISSFSSYSAEQSLNSRTKKSLLSTVILIYHQLFTVSHICFLTAVHLLWRERSQLKQIPEAARTSQKVYWHQPVGEPINLGCFQARERGRVLWSRALAVAVIHPWWTLVHPDPDASKCFGFVNMWAEADRAGAKMHRLVNSSMSETFCSLWGFAPSFPTYSFCRLDELTSGVLLQQAVCCFFGKDKKIKLMDTSTSTSFICWPQASFTKLQSQRLSAEQMFAFTRPRAVSEFCNHSERDHHSITRPQIPLERLNIILWCP